MRKPEAYILIGLPGTGKSTWCANYKDRLDGAAYISTDHYVEEYAASVGKTYNEVFQEYMPTAVNKMVDKVNAAKAAGKDIVWDQTSTTIASRKKKFNMLADTHVMIAVVFLPPSDAEWRHRLASRPGKVIPEEVISSMQKGFEYPTYAEGFSIIYNAD
jgi:predicted kinase